jgi:hypothetical protein
MRHFDIVDIITEGIHSDERGNLEIDEYNYYFVQIPLTNAYEINKTTNALFSRRRNC